ncbi:TlpA disulfide reductase family protein [Mucilaginibacter kameinonensis]|uniref:TlpA disulfide reductase family protein n=1 Tax=Mucilaginibacter kameinonensis TaxID=452286 RepID=UPI000EF84043|nr:TlpA disulfide reductase family protein [Mucilaginibacter kameinonensis]
MKTCLLLLSLFITLNLNAQSKKSYTITINANIKGLKDGDKYFLNGPSAVGFDSCVAQNGRLHFKYTGEPEPLVIGRMKDSGGNSDDFLISFFSDVYNISISGDNAYKDNIKISGSPLMDSLIRFSKIVRPIEDKREEIVISSVRRNPDSIKIQLDSIALLKKKTMSAYIQANLHSYAGIILLYYSKIDKTFTPAEADGLLRKFDLDLQNSKYGHLVKQLNRRYNQIQIGQVAPDFEQTNQYGKPMRLSAFKGKYVLLEFSSSWCGPCRTMNPQLVSLYDKFKGKDFEIVSISNDVNRQTWLKTIKDDKLTWPQLSDLKGQQNEVAIMYNINAIPHNFLIDRQGKIIADNIYPEQLTEKLTKLLK